MSERDDIVTRLRTDDASDDLLISAASLLETDADEIERLRAQVARLTAENDWLRAYTGQSAKACIYCGLGADEQGKCDRGFPGCARADDQMLCREVGVAMERDALQAEVSRLTDVLRRGGFVECDIPACNCGGWHHRYGLPERWAEITQALIDADVLDNSTGNKPLNAIKRLADERDALLARVEAAERDAGRYRWLRNSTTDGDRFRLLESCLSPNGLDAAIDAAIREGGK